MPIPRRPLLERTAAEISAIGRPMTKEDLNRVGGRRHHEEGPDQDWKNIASHVRPVDPGVSQACAEAVREVLLYPGSQADDAIAAITSSDTNTSPTRS